MTTAVRVDRPGRRSRFRRWAAVPRNRRLLLALLVGAALRLVWVVVATTPPVGLADANELLRIATELSKRRTPTFGGVRPSAYWAAGYPMLLAPFVWVARHSNEMISPLHMASLVNAAAGTTTIASTAYLAARWISPRSRNTAAWLMAIAPAQIYWTSTAHSETVLTALLIGVLALLTRTTDLAGTGSGRARWWLAIGLTVGMTILVKSSGMVLLVAPLLIVRARGGSWSRALRTAGLVALGALVPLVPWTIRNGVEVGVWTPLGTQNATVACMGNHDDASGGWHPTQRAFADCYVGSPFVDPGVIAAFPSDYPPGIDYAAFGPADEPTWYAMATRKGVRWAITHPGQEVVLAGKKMAEAWGSEWDAIQAAVNFREPTFGGWAHGPLDLAANLFLWALEIATVASLALVPRCRRATPVWMAALLLTGMIAAGLAQPHYRHPVIPLMIVLSSGGLVELGEVLRRRRVRPTGGTLDASRG